MLILPMQLGQYRLTASCLLEQRGRTCSDSAPASCCPQREESDSHGGAFFSSVLCFSWAANCSLAVAPSHTQMAVACQAVAGGQGLCVCHLLPSRAIASAEAGAGEAAGPSPGLKPATLTRFSFFLPILYCSLVSFSLVVLKLSHRFVINSGFADLRSYFWPVSCLAAAMFISLSDLNTVKTCLKSTGTA